MIAFRSESLPLSVPPAGASTSTVARRWRRDSSGNKCCQCVAYTRSVETTCLSCSVEFAHLDLQPPSSMICKEGILRRLQTTISGVGVLYGPRPRPLSSSIVRSGSRPLSSMTSFPPRLQAQGSATMVSAVHRRRLAHTFRGS